MRRFSTGLLMCLALCGGCVSLSEISRYAKLASDAAAIGALSADYRDSEVRRKALLERTAALSPEGGAAFATQQKALDASILARDKQQVQIMRIHTILAAYLGALGNLADDQVVSWDKSLDALAGAVGQIDGVPKDKMDAAGSLAKLLGRAVTDVYRRRQLGELVEVSNQPLQQAVSALQDICRLYDQTLLNEQEALTQHYAHLGRLAGVTNRELLGRDAMLDRLDEKLSLLRQRQQKSAAYRDMLTQIADGHQKIYAGRHQIDTAQVRADLGFYGSELFKLYKKYQEVK